jgi:NitT/TauT family transport system substrate-binding protein
MLSTVHRCTRRTAMRTLLGGTVALASGSLLSACTIPGPANPSKPIATTPPTTGPIATAPPTPVRAASLRTFAEAGQYIAADRGYFVEQGLDVTISEMSARELLTALTAGQVHVGGSSIGAAIFNAVAKDVPVRIVAPEARMDPGSSSLYTLVRNDLIDSGSFRDYADLVGKRVVATSGSTSHYYFGRALQRAGLAPNAVETSNLGQDFQSVTVALSTHAVDVATVPEPTATLAAERGLATKWREVSDLLPGLQVTVVLFGPELMSQRQEVGRRWMSAYLKGVRDYNEAMFKNGPHRQEVIATLGKWTDVTDPDLFKRMGFPAIDPNGHVNLDSVSDQLSFHRGQGAVTAAVEVQQIVDTRFAEAAVQELGVYHV